MAKTFHVKILDEKSISEICDLDKASFPRNYDLPPLTEKDVRFVLKHGFVLGIFTGKILASNLHVIKQTKSKWYVYTIATRPSSQGKGLAKKLLQKLIRLSKKNKIKHISVTIKPDNIPSLELFLSLGFYFKRFSKNHFGKGIHRFVFEFSNV